MSGYRKIGGHKIGKIGGRAIIKHEGYDYVKTKIGWKDITGATDSPKIVFGDASNPNNYRYHTVINPELISELETLSAHAVTDDVHTHIQERDAVNDTDTDAVTDAVNDAVNDAVTNAVNNAVTDAVTDDVHTRSRTCEPYDDVRTHTPSASRSRDDVRTHTPSASRSRDNVRTHTPSASRTHVRNSDGVHGETYQNQPREVLHPVLTITSDKGVVNHLTMIGETPYNITTIVNTLSSMLHSDSQISIVNAAHLLLLEFIRNSNASGFIAGRDIVSITMNLLTVTHRDGNVSHFMNIGDVLYNVTHIVSSLVPILRLDRTIESHLMLVKQVHVILSDLVKHGKAVDLETSITNALAPIYRPCNAV